MPLFNPSPPLWSYKSGYWYHAQGAAGATQLLVQANVSYSPIIVQQPTVFDQIGLEITTAGTTNSVTRLGIYGDVGGAPGPLILDAGTIPTSCVAQTQTIPISQALGPGVVWVASVGQGTPGTQPTVRRLGTDNSVVGMSSPATGTGFVGGWNQSGVSAGFPANAAVTSVSGGPILVMLRSQ